MSRTRPGRQALANRAASRHRLVWRAVALALVAPLGPAEAHHSIARVYDAARRATVSGIVTECRFINPHPLLFVEIVDDGGETVVWQLEMDNRFELARVGMTDETFTPGDRVAAEGSLGRTEARTLYIRSLERPADGLRYEQIGYSPRLTIERP
jgi:hypothetical protein